MRAVVYSEYGSPELRDIEKPTVSDGALVARVHAAAVNPLDWYALMGKPYFARLGSGLKRPKRSGLGVDFAGTIESVGTGVQGFQTGDPVFGVGQGACAEYVCTKQDKVAAKPASLSFEQAAGIPVAGLTALQALRDHGHLQSGQRVLINGASGGVGTFAVQIAKSFGASVTGVCSTRHVDLVRSLGADQVVDYTRDDFTRGGTRYDVMIDIAGGRSWAECRRVLAPHAKYVMIGGPRTNPWLGPLGHVARAQVASLGASQKVTFFIARVTQLDLGALKSLIEAGKVSPVVDRCYEMSEIVEAMRYLGEGHASGKIVVKV